MHGLKRGCQKQNDGRLELDTRLKREKRDLLTSPGRYCAGILLYKDIQFPGEVTNRKSPYFKWTPLLKSLYDVKDFIL